MTVVGMLVYPGFELLDLAAPLDLLARAPEMRAVTFAKRAGSVTPDLAPAIAAEFDFEGVPDIDVLFVPGGHGVSEAMADDATLDFLHERGVRAAHVTAVCTGSLLLGAAGLLGGYRATTHWRYLELLRIFGAEPVPSRVVEDRNRMTGGGVTAGLDFGLALVARLRGDEVAKRLQLGLEYNPAPPFASGHPSVAEPSMVETYVRDTMPRYVERERVAREVAARRLR